MGGFYPPALAVPILDYSAFAYAPMGGMGMGMCCGNGMGFGMGGNGFGFGRRRRKRTLPNIMIAQERPLFASRVSGGTSTSTTAINPTFGGVQLQRTKIKSGSKLGSDRTTHVKRNREWKSFADVPNSSLIHTSLESGGESSLGKDVVGEINID
jgi:hypothetical protein